MFEDSQQNLNNKIQIKYLIEGRTEEEVEESNDNEESKNNKSENQIEENKYKKIQCLFCHEYGDGKNNEGVLIYVYTHKGVEYYAHYYCLLSTPEIYFDGKTPLKDLIKKVVNAKQFKDLVYLYIFCYLFYLLYFYRNVHIVIKQELL